VGKSTINGLFSIAMLNYQRVAFKAKPLPNGLFCSVPAVSAAADSSMEAGLQTLALSQAPKQYLECEDSEPNTGSSHTMDFSYGKWGLL